MTAKKNISAEKVLDSGNIKDSAQADAMVAGADAIIEVQPKLAENKEATMSADVDNLRKEASRGNIKMKITKGTEEVRNVNAGPKGINTGGPANHNNVVKLKLDIDKKKA